MKLNYVFVIFINIGILFIFSSTIINASANEELIVCRGEIVQISARLLMNGTYGDPAPHQIVEFFDESNNLFIDSVFTDLNGYASIDWNIPLSYKLGLTIVNATFRGNDTCALAPSYQQVSIIIQAATYLDIQIETENLVPTDQMVFTILLTDDNSNSLCNESVDVFCGPRFLSSGITNVTGHARFVIYCNQSWGTLGLNNITVIYSGNLQEFYASSENSFLININKIETTIETKNQSPYFIKLNSSLSLDLRLKANNTPLGNTIINVLLNNKQFTSLITNETGIAVFSFFIDNNIILGQHNVRFEYLGNERYDSSFLDVNFVVTSSAITEVVVMSDCIIGEISTVRVYLFDVFGRSIQNTSIRLTDLLVNQTFLQKLQVNTTFSDFQLPIAKPKGIRNYRIEVIGNEFISNRTASFTLSIWVEPVLSIINTSISSYASPGQIITLGIRLSDYCRNYSNRIITILSNNELINLSSSTNRFGVIVFNLSIPIEEGIYELLVIYRGNESKYELSAYISYTIYVTRVMPVKVEFQQYSVIPSLQQIQLNLKITALNGSTLEGIELSYEWLNIVGHVFSSSLGFFNLYLPVPHEKGLYNFLYQTIATSSVQSCNGLLYISVDRQDVASSQGVGIISITMSIVLSLVIVSIPRIIRRRMIGL